MLKEASINRVREPEDLQFQGEIWQKGQFSGLSSLELSPSELSEQLRSKIGIDQFSFLQPHVATWAAFIGIRLEAGMNTSFCLDLAREQFDDALERVNIAMSERAARELPIAIVMKRFPELFSETVVEIAVNAERNNKLAQALQILAGPSFRMPRNDPDRQELLEFTWSAHLSSSVGVGIYDLLNAYACSQPEHSNFHRVLETIYSTVFHGQPLSHALRDYCIRWMPSEYIPYISVGERAHALPWTFERLTRYIENEGNEMLPRFPFMTEPLARWSENLGILLGAVPIETALKYVEATAQEELKTSCQIMQQKITAGASLSHALKDHLDIFPDDFVSMIESGERQANLAMILQQLAEREYIPATDLPTS